MLALFVTGTSLQTIDWSFTRK